MYASHKRRHLMHLQGFNQLLTLLSIMEPVHVCISARTLHRIAKWFVVRRRCLYGLVSHKGISIEALCDRIWSHESFANREQ